MDPTVTPRAFAANICIKASMTSAGATLQAVSTAKYQMWPTACVRDGENERQLHTVDHSWENFPCWALHHGGSWNNGVTSEPQPGPDLMLHFMIKYLSAPGSY